MFAFRNVNPRKKVHHSPTNAAPMTKAARGISPLRLFKQPPPPPSPPPEEETRCDNSSVDMSLYTTQSKSTITYTKGYGDHDHYELEYDPTEFTTEVSLARSKLGGWTYKEKKKPLLTPATVSITSPSEDEASLASSGYDLPQQSKSPATSRFTFGEQPTKEYNLDEEPLPLSPQHSGPVDLDESVVESFFESVIDVSSSASSSISWVFFSNDMASSKIYRQKCDDDESSPSDESSPFDEFPHEVHEVDALDNGREQQQQQQQQEASTVMWSESLFQEEDDWPHVWMDNEGEEEEVVLHDLQWCHDDEELLDRTYQQTMESIGTSKRLPRNDPLDWEDEDSTGAILLTAEELERHLNKAQRTQPLPSSSIQGFDIWKRQEEYQQRYFAKVQQNAVEQKKLREADRRQPPQSSRSNPTIELRQPHDHRHRPDAECHSKKCVSAGSTGAAMNPSVDSSIPTLEDGSAKRRRQKPQAPPRRRRWNIFPRFQSPKKNKESPSKNKKKWRSPGKKKKEVEEPSVVSLSQFMQMSLDEPSEIEKVSLAPLNKIGTMTLGSSLPEGDTMAGTRSHYLDSYDVGPKQLAKQYLEQERHKQRQAEYDKDREERLEQERVSNLKQQELQRQRLMNQQPQPRPRRYQEPKNNWEPSQCSVRSKQRYPVQEAKSIKDTESTNSPSEDSFLEKTLSICSKRSVDSSLQSRSTVILSPCVICDAAERSHIAMPCMHFYFCEKCVDQMYKTENVVCPICNAGNVAFTRVFTG